MKCIECNGSGIFDRIDGWPIPCPVCDGDGFIEAIERSVNGSPFLGELEIVPEKSTIEQDPDGSWTVTLYARPVSSSSSSWRTNHDTDDPT